MNVAEHASCVAVFQELPNCGAGLHLLGREPVQFGIEPVADDQPLLGIEHGEPLGHVVQGRVEAKVLGPKLVLAVGQQFVLALHCLLKHSNGLDHLADLVFAVSVADIDAPMP